ncbi:MAG: radical SAM protein [Candidatus Rifleibacteriota bacterium]
MRTYIFGPVPSRRLGISLGVDLTPTKTCSFDCLYCQLSKTRFHTCKRSRFCDPQEVLKELKEVLDEVARPDWITFSGTGEPTLHKDLGYLIKELKKFTPVPVCVITNSSLFQDEKVRQELMVADRILPTFSTVHEDTFQKIHRPIEGIHIQPILEGFKDFCDNFSGIIEPEVFVCPGINDTDEEVSALGDFLRSLPNLTSIYLNTAVRSPLENKILPADHLQLDDFRRRLDLSLPVITAFERNMVPARPAKWNRITAEADVLKLLLRHPCNKMQLVYVLGSPEKKVEKLLNDLEKQNKIRLQQNGEYRLVGN